MERTKITQSFAFVVVVAFLFVATVIAIMRNICYYAVLRPTIYREPTRCIVDSSSDYQSSLSKFFVNTNLDVTLTVPSFGRYVNMWHYKYNDIDDGRKCFLFFNTNTGSISCRTDLIDLCTGLGCDGILFDYYGYGKSYNNLSIEGLLESGIISYNFARKIYPPERLVLVGQSIGGSVATRVASLYPCSHLIIFSSFYSLAKVVEGKSKFSFTSSIVNNLLGELPSYQWAKKVTCPVTQLHSLTDNLISFDDALDLFASFDTDNKLFITIRGTHPRPIIDYSSIEEVANRVGLSVVDKTTILNMLAFLPHVVDGCK